ncbi:YjcB family protein [Cedecea neteri]|uniref:YjcB family protein n=1 Tax=Cedecea neteri TaxID=158822 RepID=UPI0005D81B9C|nr:YjcB family protein [Cedecea neteri]AJZ87697.1 membrane protein [Klebsiella michiganensis]WPU22788.1 YjcB family protein [Cedecea neteri]
MATITTGVMLMRWPLFSAVLMFLASSLNIQFRRSDYRALALVSSGLGIAASCWFAMGLLGLTLGDFPVIWASFKAGLVDIIARMPAEWPTMMP